MANATAPSGPKELVFKFFDELLLYSGQYALFYVMMNFAREGLGYFNDSDHMLLLAVLLAQTAALARWGERPLPRFTLSLLAPAVYAFREALEGPEFLWDMGHALFWIFSISVAILQAASRTSAPRRRRMAFEFLVTALNIAAFISVYVYFDLQLTMEEAEVAGKDLRESLSIFNLGNGFAEFLSDKSHVYLLIGGIFLALTIAVGRVKVLTLKERINELFGQYVDPAFRDEIVKGGGGSRNRELCVLFSDIRNFTALSEQEDPIRISAMLNAYFTEWEETVSRYGGSVDKYIGDAVMAIFGAREGGNPCDEATSCALEMLHKLPRLKERLAAAGLPAPERIGIGLDYGEVIMGDLGSRRRKNFTVIGDRVNTASRLEAYCKECGRPCVVSNSVASRLAPPNAARFEELGAAKLKGKADNIRIWALREPATP